MRLSARQLPLAPNALALARRLAAEDPFILLWSAAGGRSYLAARPIACSRALDPEPSLRAAPQGNTLWGAPRWIGLLPYEARRALERPGRSAMPDPRPEPHLGEPLWWRFGAIACVDDRVTVIGDDERAIEVLSGLLTKNAPVAPGAVRLALRASEPVERHAERVRAALGWIARGDVYAVNLARRLDLDVAGAPLDVLGTLCRELRPPYAAVFRHGSSSVVSTSPELLLSAEADGRLLTSPIKGTRPRGTDAASDARLARELAGDPKEHAELSMIVDVERNDLGRVSEIGSVRVAGEPEVVARGLVWHRVAHVLGRARSGVTRQALFEALLPSGSVTGAPKVRAMEIIASLESARRGLYTGGLGFITHRGEIKLAMAIRTLSVQGTDGHYFVGGGIVADSEPKRELEETTWKARQLFGRTG